MNPSIEYMHQICRLVMGCLGTRMQYKCYEHMILERGILFKGFTHVDTPYNTMKECYKNAFLLADENPDKYIYCEGVACSVIPMHHAWCVDERGNVFDPTWKEGSHYVGIPFKIDHVRRTILARKYYGVIDDPQRDFPLYRKFDESVEYKLKGDVEYVNLEKIESYYSR